MVLRSILFFLLIIVGISCSCVEKPEDGPEEDDRYEDPQTIDYSEYNIQKLFKKQFVPDKMPVAPKELCKVIFVNDDKTVSIIPAHYYEDLSELGNAPKLEYDDADPGELYTTILSDPDNDCLNPRMGNDTLIEVNVNVPGLLLMSYENYEIDEDNNVAEFVPLKKLYKDQVHRFTIRVYKQENELDEASMKKKYKKSLERVNVNLTEFAAKYNLGEPIAGNYFSVQLADGYSKCNYLKHSPLPSGKCPY